MTYVPSFACNRTAEHRTRTMLLVKSGWTMSRRAIGKCGTAQSKAVRCHSALQSTVKRTLLVLIRAVSLLRNCHTPSSSVQDQWNSTNRNNVPFAAYFSNLVKSMNGTSVVTRNKSHSSPYHTLDWRGCYLRLGLQVTILQKLALLQTKLSYTPKQ